MKFKKKVLIEPHIDDLIIKLNTEYEEWHLVNILTFNNSNSYMAVMEKMDEPSMPRPE